MSEEVTEAPEAEEEVPKKSSGLMGQVILAVILGGVAFGVVYMLPEQEVPVPECPSVFTTVKKEPEYTPPSLENISFVELEPLLVSLGKNPSANHLKISLTLEAKKGYDGDIIKAQPKLRDAFTAYLRAIEVSELEDPSTIVKLRSQLLRRAQVVMGPDSIHGVLITEFLVK